jgi:hypothetical protein
MVPVLKQLSGTQYIGDARATDMCDDGTVNVGQIINEEHKPEEFSGCFPSQGTVVDEGGCYAGYAGS